MEEVKSKLGRQECKKARGQENFSSRLNLHHLSPSTSKSFTLAEVLITLGIIGIVAAMTIPTLMQNTQNAELVTKMKKEYSVVSNAFEQLKTDGGGDFTYALADGVGTGSTLFKNVFKSKLSYLTECSNNNGANAGICLSNNIKFLNGVTPTGSYTSVAYNAPSIVLKDGASLTFSLNGSSCTFSTDAAHKNECGWILTDVNGLRPPNQWGRDIYLFHVFSDTMRPNSAQINGGTDDCANNNNGYTCAGKYLLEN